MDFVVNKTEQIAISADDPKQAANKVLAGEGNVIAMNVGVAPRPPTPPTPATMPPNLQTVPKKT